MYIYGLCDPQTSALRYVGAAVNPKERFRLHLVKKERTHKSTWIQSLQRKGLKPELFIIEEVSNDIWKREERFWIAYFKSIGADLTNATDGGDGVLGLRFSPESRLKVSKNNLGRKASPETRRKLSEAHRGERHWSFGKHLSQETRLKQRKAKLGKHLSEAHVAHLREAALHMSDETKRKIGEKSKGNKYRIGTHMSAEARKKISASNIGKHHGLDPKIFKSAEYRKKMSDSIRAWWAKRRKRSAYQLRLF